MSNQLVITSGAKVRSLEGVLTGTAGVVSSVPYGGANGVATLDGSGKVPLSQLPASVITYLGTWNASTNTPTLTNGVGDVGDLYICNVAGTVNFGAGPITFAVGDWVIYSGTTWEKSGGASGTVTSVAMTTPTGLSVTGSPITTSGTLALSLSNGYTIPTTSFLSGLVPYTGATNNLDLGNNVLFAYDVFIKGNGTNNATLFLKQGIAALNVQNGYSNILATGTKIGFLVATSAVDAYYADFNFSSLTAQRNYILPNASGTLALTSNLSSYVPYTGATANVDLGSYYLTTARLNANEIKATTSGGIDIHSNSGTQVALFGAGGGSGTTFYGGINGTTANFSGQLTLGSTITNGTNTYTLPSITGTLALLEGTQTFTGDKTFSGDTIFNGGIDVNNSINLNSGVFFRNNAVGSTLYTNFSILKSGSTETLTYLFTTANYSKLVFNDSANYTYTFPTTSGTLALTSNLSSYVPYTGATSDVALGNANSLSAYKVSLYNGSTYTALLGNTDGMSINFGTYVNRFYFNNANNTYTFPNASGIVALTSDIPSLSGYVQGSGTTSYHAKFTGSGTIGNSMLTDDGTTLQSIGATRSNLYLKAASNSYYSQLAFTNGSNGSFGGISYNNSGQYMQFEANSSEWMRLTSDGKLGIGTTSPNYTLDVTGTGRFTGALTGTIGTFTNGSVGYALNTTSAYTGSASNNPIITFGRAGSAVAGAIGYDDVLGSLYTGTTTNHNFLVKTNSATVATFTSSGNVGIGTSSPTSLLHTSTSGQNRLRVYSSGAGSFLDIENAGNSFYIGVDNSSGTEFGGPAYARTIYGTGAYPMVFYTNNSERMRITSAGNVGIGTSSPGVSLEVNGLIRSVPVYNNTTATAANLVVSAGGTFERSTSSLKYKKDVRNYDKGLNELLQIRPVYYKGKSESDGDKQFAGLIAEEIHELGLTEFVQYANDGTPDALAYTHMIALLISSIKEQQAQIELLSNKIVALESK